MLSYILKMNNKFRIIIEYTWLAVTVMALAAIVTSAMNRDMRNVAVFSIISLISFVMFIFRRNQRKRL